jgi:hypothetical protein
MGNPMPWLAVKRNAGVLAPPRLREPPLDGDLWRT